MSAVAIYLYAENIIVVPQAGSGGHFIDVEPIETVAPQADAIREAVQRALAVSEQNRDNDTPPKGWKTPLLKYTNERSYKAFAAKAALCYVFAEGGVYEVERWLPARDGRGFEPSPRGPKVLNSPDGLGTAVLELFELTP
jgi:hypothetical protein